MRKIILCRYSYDPMDRFVGTMPPTDVESQRFYCKNLLATEIQRGVKHSIFQNENWHLAHQQRNGETVNANLLATDVQRSVLQVLNPAHRQPISYSPYGHRSVDNGLHSLLGFNGERQDPVTGCYFLGNGYRMFNPVLMRFNKPDSWSPFGDGGLNTYAYCLGDPVNQSDKSGHAGIFTAIANQLRNALGRARARLSIIQQPGESLTQHFHGKLYTLKNRTFRLSNRVTNDYSTTTFTYSSQLQRTVHNTPLTLLENSYNSLPGKLLQPDLIDIPPIPAHTLGNLEKKLGPVNFDNYLARTTLHSNYGKNFDVAASNLLAGNVNGVTPKFAEARMTAYINTYQNNYQPHYGLRESFLKAISNKHTAIRQK